MLPENTLFFINFLLINVNVMQKNSTYIQLNHLDFWKLNIRNVIFECLLS